MKCKNCGSDTAEGGKFCVNCGVGVLNEKLTESKKPLTGSRIIKKIFQIISILLLLSSISMMYSFSIDDPVGWLSTIYDIFNITAVISLFIIASKGWQYRKGGSKNKEWFGWRWICFLIFISLVGLGTAILSQGVTISREKALQNPENQITYINNVVIMAKENMPLPNRIDDSTTITDITAENNAIRYHYLLSNIETSELSDESLKESLFSSICQNESTNNLFEQGINLEFLYTIENSPQTYLIKFTKSDCL